MKAEKNGRESQASFSAPSGLPGFLQVRGRYSYLRRPYKFPADFKDQRPLELSHSQLLLLGFLRNRLACEGETLFKSRWIKDHADFGFTPGTGRNFETYLKRFETASFVEAYSEASPVLKPPSWRPSVMGDQERSRTERPGAAFSNLPLCWKTVP